MVNGVTSCAFSGGGASGSLGSSAMVLVTVSTNKQNVGGDLRIQLMDPASLI